MPEPTTIAAFKRALTPGRFVDIVNPRMERMNRRAEVLRTNTVDAVLSHPEAPEGSHLGWPKKGRVFVDGDSFLLMDPDLRGPWLIVTPVAPDPTDDMDDGEIAAHNEAMATDPQYRDAIHYERN